MQVRERSWVRRGAAGLTCAVLVACSSPMPPWPTAPSAATPAALRPAPGAVAATPGAPAAPASRTAAAASAGAGSMPAATARAGGLPAQPARPSSLPAAPVPVPPPRSAALAARFPEPVVTWATPAFEPGRTAFTSNDELRAILREIERGGVALAGNTAVTILPLGASQEGVPIEALAFTRDPAAATPAAPTSAIATARRPAVLIVAGQHGDEPAGSEALIVAARELVAGGYDPVLAQVDIYIVPRLNPDGAALGQRAAADGVDVNRDHLLLRTPEAQALAELVRDVAPIVVLDLHEYAVDAGFEAKFGGVQRFDALLQAASTANLHPFTARAAEQWFRAPLAAGLGAAGFTNEWYYTVSIDAADRKLAMGDANPAIGRNASGLRNAVSLLVETRGGGLGRVDLKRRVQTDLVTIGNVLGNAAAHAADLVKLRQFVERDVAAKACQGEAVIEAAPLPSEHALTVLDAETGAIKRVSVAWDSTLELRLLKSRPRPCGYWLAASETDAVQRLRWLGVDVKQLDEAGEVRGESYREIAREPVEAVASGVAPRIRVQAVPALLDLAAGGYYVSLEQPLANLAIAVLEPESPASYASARIIASTAGEARILARPDIRMTALP